MADPKIKFIEVSLQKVSVGPGDVVVFSSSEPLSDCQQANLKDVGKQFFPDNGILLLKKGMKVGVIEKE